MDPELAQWVLTTFSLLTGEVGEKNLGLYLECRQWAGTRLGMNDTSVCQCHLI